MRGVLSRESANVKLKKGEKEGREGVGKVLGKKGSKKGIRSGKTRE